MIRRPCALVVSAQVFLNDRKLAPRWLMVSSRFNRSRVDLATHNHQHVVVFENVR